MWSAVGGLLPLATGLALSPFAIVTGIVLLLGRGGRVKTAAFGLGWLVAIGVLAGVAFWLVEIADEADHEATSDGVDILQLVLAVLFLALAYVSWRKRPRPGEPVKKNKMLERLDGIGIAGALGIGLVQGFVVIKNPPLALAAGARIGEAGLSDAAAIGALVIFAVVATAGVLIPFLVSIVGGSAMAARLAEARTWLEQNMSPITVTVLVVLGSFFLGQGLGILG